MTTKFFLLQSVTKQEKFLLCNHLQLPGLRCDDAVNESEIHQGGNRIQLLRTWTLILPLHNWAFTLFAFILKIDCPDESFRCSVVLWFKKTSSHTGLLGTWASSQALSKECALQKYLLKVGFDLIVKTLMKRQ